MAKSIDTDVVIVGSGPVGLFLGMSLCQTQPGLKVTLLEAGQDINQSPRALMYFPIVLNEFRKLGILEKVVAAGHKNEEGLCFRTSVANGDKVLAKIPPGHATDGVSIDYGVQLGQPRLAKIIRDHAEKSCPNLSILYDTTYTSLEHDEEGVTVKAATPQESVIVRASFAIACDGASSQVRKDLDIPFDGFTWKDWRFLAINIRYPFEKYGYPAANHVIDEEDWAVVVRAGNAAEGLWRVATGIDPSIPVEELRPHVEEKLERILPGPRPLKYDIEAINPYWAHERCAARFNVGRVILCGDAAHVVNPLTALGLTTGLLDAATLSRILPLALDKSSTKSWKTIVEKYSTTRRSEFLGKVQKRAIEGKHRIHSNDKKIKAEREDFFNMMNKNPGFANFVASTMIETLPENFFPSPWTRLLTMLSTVLFVVRLVPMIMFWKIKASVT